MAKEKALEICKNLVKTLKKMKTSSIMRYEDTIFEHPSVSQNKLRSMLEKLMKKYNFKKEQL
tara:strand:+ start:16156 stop:16341 length:186 start_codon:yes stop_codon:yes gene_type:complete